MKEEYCRLCMEEIHKKISVFDYLKQDQLLCTSCKMQLKRINRRTHLENIPLTILYEYNDFLENMIFQYKEGHDVALRDIFFYEDIKVLNDKYRHYTIVLMPSSQEKLCERGFVPVEDMLTRCKLPIIEPFYKSENHKQSLQSFKDREHIKDVIHRKPGFKLPKTKLLLVDDVCTSGSTLKYAYQLLKQHTYKIEALVLSAHPLFVESCDEKGLKRDKRFSILKRKINKEGEVK